MSVGITTAAMRQYLGVANAECYLDDGTCKTSPRSWLSKATEALSSNGIGFFRTPVT